tara:strand:- start:1063 stop:1458 length:396 start_codon:yes stop_codon:yes gene_type:complete
MGILDRYNEELKGDVTMDAFTIHDVQLKLPAIKHKWVGRLMRHKSTLYDLRREKKNTQADLVETISKEAKVTLSVTAVNNLINQKGLLDDNNDKISEQVIVIEFLEKVEKILSSMTFDIRNLTEIMKLETQ